MPPSFDLHSTARLVSPANKQSLFTHCDELKTAAASSRHIVLGAVASNLQPRHVTRRKLRAGTRTSVVLKTSLVNVQGCKQLRGQQQQQQQK